MGKRLVKAVVWLVVMALVLHQTPSAGQSRSVSIRLKSKNKAQARAKAALKLGAKLVVLLPGILERFRAQRRELLARGAGAAYPRDGVAALLDSTEASLQKEFKKPDFAPLRAHIAEVFAGARTDLGLSTRTALRPLPAPQATVASLGFVLAAEVSDSRLERSLADRVLDAIGAFLVDLSERATRKDLTVTLCVMSDPQKAKVSIHAVTGRKIDPTKTNGRLENLIRGKYLYTVEKRAFPKIESSIDLYDKRRPALECEFDGDGCAVREGWPEACRGR